MTRWSLHASFAGAIALAALALTSTATSFAQSPASPAGTGYLVLQPGPEGKDASAQSPYPNQNYGEHTYLGGIGLPWYGIGYIEFDLSSLPADAVVTAATLDIYGGYQDGTLTFDAAASAWSEMTICWNNRPAAVTPSLAITYPITRGPVGGPCYMGCVQSFDVTGIVAAWAAGTIPNYGFLVNGNTPPYGWGIASFEATSEPHPKLSVTFDSSLPAVKPSWGALKTLYR